MRYSKRYLSCFLIVIILICSIDIGFAFDKEVYDAINISSEDGSTLEEKVNETKYQEKISNSEEIVSNEHIEKLSEEPIIEAEPSETDNWELGLVFYDSTVDNGKTPLTEINWDASDGGYRIGESRIIAVQINYRNTNCIKTYQPGELEISIPNLVYNTYANKDSSPCWSTSVTVGANDSTHTGYDWNFVTGNNPNNSQNMYKFRNANIIEEKSNFEGSIQIVYTITPGYEIPEQYDESCEHSYTKNLIARLNNITDSNEINLTYFREYIHPWNRNTYSVTKTARKITSYDGLGANASDYIWVKYGFQHTGNFYRNSSYPYIYAKIPIYKDKIPEGCIVYDGNMNLLTPDENGYSSIEANDFPNISSSVYIGYPKSIYNETNNNLNITNTVELWGTYNDRTESELLSTASVNLNLADYEFTYSGNLYGIYKKYNRYLILYQQDIQRNFAYNQTSWSLNPTAIYTGKPITLKIGDDLLFATSMNGNYVKLEDNEYHFTYIEWNPSSFKNGNNQKIQANKYDCELWVRYKDTNEYLLYESFKNPSDRKGWNFTKEDGIVGFYFMIYDMNESITSSGSGSGSFIIADTRFHKQDVPESGMLYNFCYLQVYFKDGNGNLILQNEPGLNSYNNFITKEDIASFDKEVYGTYMQRDYYFHSWKHFDANTFSAKFEAKKEASLIIQDVINEQFTGRYTVSNKISGDSMNFNYKDEIDSERAVKGFKIYDLLPKGMELTSSKEEIQNSLNIVIYSIRVYYSNFKKLSENEIKEITNTDVIITKNWHNTGRTRIEIKCNFKEPVYIHSYDNSEYSYFNYSYNYAISYDALLEYGNIWTNYCYVDKLETQEKGVNLNKIVTDNGKYDSEAVDIDEDGDMTDKLAYAKAQKTITSVISTHQDVQKSVKTDKSNFSTGTVESSLDSEYEYKLRIRTGQNDITNLIIYDSLEEYALTPEGNFVPAYGAKEHWNGEFLGTDTSYAESKGYTVKTYYSENVQAGNLYDEEYNLNPEYMEYTDTTDKSKVKSLAFEYLDTDGNPAIMPANSLTYVLIKMKSPNDENITSLAYNGCRTQWQAMDEFGQPVDFITGINSNIVKVFLPNTKRGSYLVRHEYYYRDYKGDLILENTVSEELVSNIPVDTIIKTEDQNHIETNNNKLYTFTEDSGDIIIKENETQEIILKYVRDEEYGSYQVKHEYYVKEEINVNALAVTFNSKCSGESANYDYIELYYQKDGNTYKLGKYRANDLAGKTVNIPSSDFYLYWRTDGSNNQYYGFSIDKIEPVYLEETITGTNATLPNYTVTELTGSTYPETEHNPYKNNSNLLWHYTGQTGLIDKYTLENRVSEELVPNILIGTIIKAEEQNHIETNNNKQYMFKEDTGDITIEKDVTKEITLKYIREQEYGSYVVKHEYYVKDFNNNLTLENAVSEEPVSNIPIDTVIKANKQNHIETNNDKQYTYTEDTGDITIQKDVMKEITIKYVRDEEYTTELPETGSTENIKNLIYVIFFLMFGSISFFIATKKRKY